MTHARLTRAAVAGAMFIFALSACPNSSIAPAPHSALQDTALIRKDITYLASDALYGRGTGTAGNDSAAAYIAHQYAVLQLALPPEQVHALGSHANIDRDDNGFPTQVDYEKSRIASHCSLAFTEGFLCAPDYRQRFLAKSVAAAHAGLPAALFTQNVVAIIKGSDPALAHEYVVVGAHFDHLGRNPFNSMDPEAGDVIRPGADDNASGTAAVMELARIFAKHPAKRSMLLLNFSGEELGLLGSQYFVEHSPVKLDSMQIMMNYDMVGRLRNDNLLVYGVATATELKPLVDSTNAAVGKFALKAIGDGYGPSDQSSFYGAGVPVLFFFTDQHEDYHRASNVASKINVEGEARVIDYSAALLRALGDRPTRLTFVKTAPPMRGGPGGNGAWFGSVPDMGAVDVIGVRLAGVTSGSPADKAGALKGDVIVEFGGDPVKDIYAYTAALGKHKPGDVVTVVVMRDGQRVTLTATLGKRGG